jgi:hypothetical protein
MGKKDWNFFPSQNNVNVYSTSSPSLSFYTFNFVMNGYMFLKKLTNIDSNLSIGYKYLCFWKSIFVEILFF